jgi:CHASE3 domain sensor protein
MNQVDAFPETGEERRSLILRELGLPILFGAAVLLISATMLLGVNISAMQNDVARIQNIQKILLVVGDAEAGVVGEQLTVRSYALTGDKRFLDFQNNERVKLLGAINKLEPLAVVEPGGPARIHQIRVWVEQHMALWASLRGIGPDRAAILGQAIEDTNKRRIMLGTRKVLADYRADQVRALGERQQQLTQQLSRAFVLGIGIIIAAFVLGGVGLIAGQFRIPSRLR